MAYPLLASIGAPTVMVPRGSPTVGPRLVGPPVVGPVLRGAFTVGPWLTGAPTRGPSLDGGPTEITGPRNTARPRATPKASLVAAMVSMTPELVVTRPLAVTAAATERAEPIPVS